MEELRSGLDKDKEDIWVWKVSEILAFIVKSTYKLIENRIVREMEDTFCYI